MNKQKIIIVLLAVTLLSIIWSAPARAQGSGWSEPYRLSSDAGKSSEAYMVADQYGYVHAFWTETLFSNGRTVIKYARFDGTIWTKPNDIYVASTGIKNISPVVDRQGTLHIVWSEGVYDVVVYYAHAPANNALSVQNWSKPLQINVPARPVYFKIDSKGVFHILYINQTEESGVYYIRSEDQGITWSNPFWLDPDIRPEYMPDSLNFEIDENDGLHATWFYGFFGDRESEGEADWVRYAHSLDGGHSWSPPFTIDKHIEGTDYSLSNATPRMIVQGQTVHVIWAAGSLPYRHHRFSTDGGMTWSAPVPIFGALHGQAGDGLAVDGAGRVHFFAQIRYPMAIWHATWNQTGWSVPSLVYLVAEQGEDIGNRVHAHDTIPVIRAGNQLLLTFADGPAVPTRRLFVTYITLDDVSPVQTMPTATSIPVPSPTPGELTAMPNSTATVVPLDSADIRNAPPPDLALRVAIVPTLLILGATMFMQLFHNRKH